MMSTKRSRAAYESDSSALHAPYVLYGTALPEYDPAAREDGSYVPVWKQEVTDDQGRKRLHGAFTGGWSAGYFNTVGSKEGWTPATFVSSRSNRAKDARNQQQKPEDFMDEEDLAARVESQRIETQGTFAGLGSSADGGGTSKGLFADLFRDSGDTIGVKLLQRMGWRQGQGLGPKTKRAAKGDRSGELYLFAPDDTRTITFEKKFDRKGLGFAGESRLDTTNAASEENNNGDRDPQILPSNHTKLLEKSSKARKTGLGVGVLNDTGSDEEDPYVIGPQINYNRVIGGDKKHKKGKLLSNNASSMVQRPVSTSMKAVQRTNKLPGLYRGHDGRLPLEGFVLVSPAMAVHEEYKFPAPTVPDGWKPSTIQPQSGTENTTFVSTADAAKASALDPKARASLLGEQPLAGKSVFDFISTASRDRIATVTGRTDLPQARGELPPPNYKPQQGDVRKALWDRVPALDKEIASSALQRGATGWMPYAEDEAKRSRYKLFLELRAEQRSDLPPRPPAFSFDDWTTELNEFAQAAQVFKPISGLMASRFTSSSSANPSAKPVLGSDAADTNPVEHTDTAEKAAALGMYGPLTRVRELFYPTRLLCKRFGVKPPAHVLSGTNEGQNASSSNMASSAIVSQASLDRMMTESKWSHSGGLLQPGEAKTSDTVGQAPQQLPKVDVEKNDALEGRKAGEAVFKAIFGDDSDQE